MRKNKSKFILNLVTGLLTLIFATQPVLAGGTGTCLVGDTVTFVATTGSTLSGYSNYTQDNSTSDGGQVGGTQVSITAEIPWDDIPQDIRDLILKEDPDADDKWGKPYKSPDKPSSADDWLNNLPNLPAAPVLPDESTVPDAPSGDTGNTNHTIDTDDWIDPETGEIKIPDELDTPELSDAIQKLMAARENKQKLYNENKAKNDEIWAEYRASVKDIEELYPDDDFKEKQKEYNNQYQEQESANAEKESTDAEQLSDKAEQNIADNEALRAQREKEYQDAIDYLTQKVNEYMARVKAQNDFDADPDAEGSIANRNKKSSEALYEQNKAEISASFQNVIAKLKAQQEELEKPAILFTGQNFDGERTYASNGNITVYDVSNNEGIRNVVGEDQDTAQEYLDSHERTDANSVSKTRQLDIGVDFNPADMGDKDVYDLGDGYSVRKMDTIHGTEYQVFENSDTALIKNKGFCAPVQDMNGAYIGHATENEAYVASVNLQLQNSNSVYQAFVDENDEIYFVNTSNGQTVDYKKDDAGLYLYNDEQSYMLDVLSIAVGQTTGIDKETIQDILGDNLSDVSAGMGMTENELLNAWTSDAGLSTEQMTQLSSQIADLQPAAFNQLFDVSQANLSEAAQQLGLDEYEVQEYINWLSQADPESGNVPYAPSAQLPESLQNPDDYATDADYQTAIWAEYFGADNMKYVSVDTENGTAFFNGVTFSYNIDNSGNITMNRTAVPSTTIYNTMLEDVGDYYLMSPTDEITVLDLDENGMTPDGNYQVIVGEDGQATAVYDKNGEAVNWSWSDTSDLTYMHQYIYILDDNAKYIGASNPVGYYDQKSGTFVQNKSDSEYTLEKYQAQDAMREYDVQMMMANETINDMLHTYFGGGLYAIPISLIDKPETESFSGYAEKDDSGRVILYNEDGTVFDGTYTVRTFNSENPDDWEIHAYSNDGFNEYEWAHVWGNDWGTVFGFMITDYSTDENGNYTDVADTSIMGEFFLSVLNNYPEYAKDNSMESWQYMENMLRQAIQDFDEKSGTNIYDSIQGLSQQDFYDITGVFTQGVAELALLINEIYSGNYTMTEAELQNRIQTISDKLSRENMLAYLTDMMPDVDPNFIDALISDLFTPRVTDNREIPDSSYDLSPDDFPMPSGGNPENLDDGAADRIAAFEDATKDFETLQDSIYQKMLERYQQQLLEKQREYEDWKNGVLEDQDAADQQNQEQYQQDVEDMSKEAEEEKNRIDDTNQEGRNTAQEQRQQLLDEAAQLRDEQLAAIQKLYEDAMAEADKLIKDLAEQIKALNNNDEFTDIPDWLLDPALPVPDPSQNKDPQGSVTSPEYPDYPETPQYPGGATVPSGEQNNEDDFPSDATELLNDLLGDPDITTKGNVKKPGSTKTITYTYTLNNGYKIQRVVTQKYTRTLDSDVRHDVLVPMAGGGYYAWYVNGAKGNSSSSIQNVTFNSAGQYSIKVYANKAIQIVKKYEYVTSVKWLFEKDGRVFYSWNSDGLIGGNGRNIATSISNTAVRYKCLDSWTENVVVPSNNTFITGDIDSDTIRIPNK